LDTSPPAVDPSQSTRERYSEHASNPACSSCHDLIDPIGFGFEHYDAVGRWRAADGVHSIDASGAILYSPRSDAAFDGLAELGSHLAQSPDVAACFIQQWSEYLYGLHHDETLEPSVQALKEHFASSSKNLKETLARFIELPHLKVRIEDGTVEEPLYPTNESPLTVLDLLQGRTDLNAQPEDNDDDLGNGDDNGILTLTQTEASRWNSGACFDVIVTNQSTVEQTWRVEMPFEGTINNLWNAEIIQAQGNTATIIGLSWNALLAPQASASFGYCVTF
jgi:cellulase/cellobiase CelA1